MIHYDRLRYFAATQFLLQQEERKDEFYQRHGDQYQQQGVLTDAYANAVQEAAKNSNGAMTGFMGMGMMGMNTGNPFGTVTSNVANTTNYAAPNPEAYNAAVKPVTPTQNVATTFNEGTANNNTVQQNEVINNQTVANIPTEKWKCKCGMENGGRFCVECGMSKEEATKKTIKCPKCGTENKENAKFCGECGQKLV